MEILYEYTTGSAPMPVFTIITWVISAFFLIYLIAYIIHNKQFSLECLMMILIVAIGVAVGFRFNDDTRQKEVKATINNTISFEEINKKYEFIKQEGELYTFKVKENDE